MVWDHSRISGVWYESNSQPQTRKVKSSTRLPTTVGSTYISLSLCYYFIFFFEKKIKIAGVIITPNLLKPYETQHETIHALIECAMSQTPNLRPTKSAQPDFLPLSHHHG